MNDVRTYLECREDHQRLAVLRAEFALECARELARRAVNPHSNESLEDSLRVLSEADPNGD